MNGLVSISFRDQKPETLIAAVKAAGLEAIEWGGDIHCPHGDIEKAAQLKAACEKAGIAMPTYGSYYRIAESEPELFEAVLASANALGTPNIRVWGGNSPSDKLKTEDYRALVEDARRICDLAPHKKICLECHNKTVTDEYHTALQFIQDVDRPNLRMLWQPNQFRSLDYNLDALRALLPYVEAAHVFHWKREQRLPLWEGAAEWAQYLTLLGNRPLMLEFMHDNRLESLNETAETLLNWKK